MENNHVFFRLSYPFSKAFLWDAVIVDLSICKRGSWSCRNKYITGLSYLSKYIINKECFALCSNHCYANNSLWNEDLTDKCYAISIGSQAFKDLLLRAELSSNGERGAKTTDVWFANQKLNTTFSGHSAGTE